MKEHNNYYLITQDILSFAKKNQYKSYDISDLKKTNMHQILNNHNFGFFGKLLSVPYDVVSKYRPEWIRRYVKEKGYIYPQAQAFVIRSLIQLAKKNYDLDSKSEVESIFKWLKQARNPNYKQHGWGQPFIWYSDVPFPVNIPRATVSSQVAWAFIDMFEYYEDEEYLELAIDVCELFINQFTHDADENGNICFSYTTIDDFQIHNASMLAASVFMKVYHLTGNEKYAEYGIKATNFTLSHQNEDGSFCYWGPSKKTACRIDNYHTGFVLESLRTIKDDVGDNRYNKSFKIGMDYYYHNLFDGIIPKMTNKKMFPIDIQSCAQSIITLHYGDENEKYKSLAHEIAKYTINNFYLPDKQHFAYRNYMNGFQDKSYYFRWGDAWMLRALSYLI